MNLTEPPRGCQTLQFQMSSKDFHCSPLLPTAPKKSQRPQCCDQVEIVVLRCLGRRERIYRHLNPCSPPTYPLLTLDDAESVSEASGRLAFGAELPSATTDIAHHVVHPPCLPTYLNGRPTNLNWIATTKQHHLGTSSTRMVANSPGQ